MTESSNFSVSNNFSYFKPVSDDFIVQINALSSSPPVANKLLNVSTAKMAPLTHKDFMNKFNIEDGSRWNI